MMHDEHAENQQYDVEKAIEDYKPEDYEDSLKSPETILSSDLADDICRVCLESGTLLIFGGDDSEDLSLEVQHFAGIDVSPDDNLPQNLCHYCRDLLYSAISFRFIAQKSDRILKNRTEEDHFSNSDNESKGFECANVLETDDLGLDRENNDELEDEKDLENRIFLEYTETINDSENVSIASDMEESNITFNDNSSIPESIDQELDQFDNVMLETLVDSLNKNARFLQCEVCKITFRTIEQVNEHSLRHDSTEIVTCEVCKNIIQKDSYSVHLKLHRVSFNQRKEKKYQKVECVVCGKAVSKSYLKKHIEMHSPNKGYKKCTICNQLLSGTYLSDHMKLKHNIPSKPDEEKSILKLKCPVCSRYFKETTYESHVASHAMTKKKYVCEECGKECLSPSSFSTHLLTHKEVYKFKCQFCPYRGKHLGLLKVHVRTHTKDYLYKCAICKSSFITKSNLSAHEKTHSAGAKFPCSECGKSFATHRILQNHIVRVHKKIKAFSCDLCGKSYACKDVMMAHKRRIHHVAPIGRIGRKPSYLLGAQEKKGVEDVSNGSLPNE